MAHRIEEILKNVMRRFAQVEPWAGLREAHNYNREEYRKP